MGEKDNKVMPNAESSFFKSLIEDFRLCLIDFRDINKYSELITPNSELKIFQLEKF